MDIATELIWVATLAFFGGAWLTGRLGARRTAWIFPTIWIGAVITVAVRGSITSIRDVLLAALGLVVLLIAIGSGSSARNKGDGGDDAA